MRLRSAETLRALMRQQGLSLSGLAATAQCSKSFISHLLSGRRNTCTDALADRIAAALDVPTRIVFVPSKSITDRQSDYRSLPPAAVGPSHELGSGAQELRSSTPEGESRPGPGPRSARSQITGGQARFGSRCGWVPRRALLGNRGEAVECPSGSLHRRPGALTRTQPEATAQLTEVTNPCSFEAATR